MCRDKLGMRMCWLWKNLFLCAVAVLFLFASPCLAFGAGVKHLVIIDPAHGGAEDGVKVSKDTSEKDITLQIGKLIEENLKKISNMEPRLTRSKDISMAIGKRRELAVRLKADLFVSIHVNAGFGTEARGYEVYFSGFDKPSSPKESSNEIVKDMVRTQYLNDSVRFSQIFEQNFSKVFPREGRGLRDAPFLIYEELPMPSVAIELGFATNIQNSKKLADRKTQQAIADAIAKSIREYFSFSGV